MIAFAKDGSVDWENSFDEDPMPEPKFACPVCGKVTLAERGNWNSCQNCGWIDDIGQNEENPDEKDCANKMSLNEAREAYKKGQRVI